MSRSPILDLDNIRALSVRQPWAWAILHGGKRVENRDWSGFGPRGPLLLHAGKTCTRREYADGVEAIHDARADLGLPPVDVPPLADLPRGGLVGVVSVAGAQVNEEDAGGYAVPGALGVLLDEVRALPFVPLRGALGLFYAGPWAVEHATERLLYARAVSEMIRPPQPCPGCSHRIEPRLVACRRCWRRVRDALWAALRSGRAPEYQQARAAVVAALKE